MVAGLEIEPSPTNVYDMSWDANYKALKIHMKYTGTGKEDNYSGSVSIGTGIKKKKADISATAPAFNPFMGVASQDSIIADNYIDMRDLPNRSIAVYCKLVDNYDSATIRFDIFDVNGRKTNFDNSSVKKGIKPSVDFQKIMFNWSYDSGANFDNI